MSLLNKIRQILSLAFPRIGSARSALRLGSLYNEHLAHTPLILWLPPRMSGKILLVGLSLFFAPSPSPQALGVNVFSQALSPSHSAYVFPPFVLVGPLIRFLASQSCPYTIVVTDLRPRKYWWPLLVSSCVDSFKLGSKGDHSILLFPTNTGVKSRPLQWDLWVFRICPV